MPAVALDNPNSAIPAVVTQHHCQGRMEPSRSELEQFVECDRQFSNSFPVALNTAFATAAAAPVMPISPMPRAPSGECSSGIFRYLISIPECLDEPACGIRRAMDLHSGHCGRHKESLPSEPSRFP